MKLSEGISKRHLYIVIEKMKYEMCLSWILKTRQISIESKIIDITQRRRKKSSFVMSRLNLTVLVSCISQTDVNSIWLFLQRNFLCS